MNVLIAGCGYVGRAAGVLLSNGGHRVWGLCRSEASLDRVRAAGLEPFQADLTDAASLRKLPPVDAVIACQAPSKGETYASAYYDAIEELLRAIKPAERVRFVMVSSTSVYGPRAGGWVDADTPIREAELDENALVLRKTEKLVLSAPVRAGVLRLSGIYGPERNRIEALRSGRLKPMLGPAYTNRIHRDDAASALALVTDWGKPGQVYLASDDQPVPQSEFYAWLCEKIQVPPPVEPRKAEAAAAFEASKRCNNEKLKNLGWTLRYPGYREGYGALFS